jgi:tetratricopeptide (TPR) repeat protein
MQAVLRAAPHREAFAEAKASALRALTLDGGSADAQVALGTVQFQGEWDWSAADRSLQRALHINPDHTEALLQYGSLHDALGRLDEGLRLKQRALARDPHSPLVLVHIALSHSHQRRYDEALWWAHRALEIDPTHLLASVFVAFLYWRLGDIDSLIAHNIRAATARGVANEAMDSLRQSTARLRQVYAAKGAAGVSRFMADHMGHERYAGDASTTAPQRAALYGAAGLMDEAFVCLDEAIAGRDPGMVYLAVGALWDPLRNDPRFADRLRAVSLHALDS